MTLFLMCLASFLCMFVWLYVHISPFYKDTSPAELEPALMTYLNLIFSVKTLFTNKIMFWGTEY